MTPAPRQPRASRFALLLPLAVLALLLGGYLLYEPPPEHAPPYRPVVRPASAIRADAKGLAYQLAYVEWPLKENPWVARLDERSLTMETMGLPWLGPGRAALEAALRRRWPERRARVVKVESFPDVVGTAGEFPTKPGMTSRTPPPGGGTRRLETFDFHLRIDAVGGWMRARLPASGRIVDTRRGVNKLRKATLSGELTDVPEVPYPMSCGVFREGGTTLFTTLYRPDPHATPRP